MTSCHPMKYVFRDHFVYAACQWETPLQCNVVSHWLSAHTKRTLCVGSCWVVDMSDVAHCISSCRFNIYTHIHTHPHIYIYIISQFMIGDICYRPLRWYFCLKILDAMWDGQWFSVTPGHKNIPQISRINKWNICRTTKSMDPWL